jgi:hypothetical protein
MIVEFFGPPCVGKTTLASAVATRLRERGCAVRLVSSYRPLEQPAISGNGTAAGLLIPAFLRRVMRPLVESIAAAAHPTSQGEAAAVTALMRLVAAKSLIRSVRLRQYLLRLSCSWHAAAVSSDIVLFDQAFIQAVSSALAAEGAADRDQIGLALDALPRADLLIRLNAPRAVLEMRLADRQSRQGRIERLFDTWTHLNSLRVFDQMEVLLQALGHPMICIDATDRRSLSADVDRVTGMLTDSRCRKLVASDLDAGPPER